MALNFLSQCNKNRSTFVLQFTLKNLRGNEYDSCELSSWTKSNAFTLNWNWNLNLKSIFSQSLFFVYNFLQFLCVNCRVSRRTFSGKSQIVQKKAKIAKTGGRQLKYWRFLKLQFNLGYKLSKAFPFPVIGSKYVSGGWVRVSTKSMEIKMGYRWALPQKTRKKYISDGDGSIIFF